jgi:hypothetical protein
MKKSIAAILCATLLCPGCASAGGARIASAPAAAAAQPYTTLFASYVTHLAIGSRVRVAFADGRTIKGTLMRADGAEIVVQPRTRIPEPPMAIPLDRIATVDLDTHASVGKTVGIGIASGAGGVFAAFLVLAMIFAGD